MGQGLLNPPSVEGWHTGAEWINSGSLMQRVNFTAELVGDIISPGIKAILDRLQAQGTRIAAESCSIAASTSSARSYVSPGTGAGPSALARRWGLAGTLRSTSRPPRPNSPKLLQLIVATREYQFA